MGLYTQQDPIGIAGGLNLYGYANGDPVNYSDPFGLSAECCRDLFAAGASLLPVVGDGNDVVALFTGHDMLGGEDLDGMGRTTAALGLVVGSGSSIRAGGRVAKEAVGGIYEFVATTGRRYVGQSKDIARRIGQHISDGRLGEGAEVIWRRVTGGRTAREVAEQVRIDELGGVDNLENIRNPIGTARRHLIDD
jgi:uncharacterized protein RhaS with RHS repeats